MKQFYSFLLHWEKIWCLFPKGRNCDFGAVLERSITECIKWNMMHMRLWKFPLQIPRLCSQIQVTLGSFVKPFPAITQGELEPQFANKDSYFEQNIKKVCRSNLGFIKNPWTTDLIFNIIHIRSEKIGEHLGQFVGLDIKTSQGSKLGKKWKNWPFNKISKREIKVVS